MEMLTSFGDGGRQPGQFFGVHSIATDSKGNIYTTETYEGKRVQKFVYKGLAPIPAGAQGPVWPQTAAALSERARLRRAGGWTHGHRQRGGRGFARRVGSASSGFSGQ